MYADDGSPPACGRIPRSSSEHDERAGIGCYSWGRHCIKGTERQTQALLPPSGHLIVASNGGVGYALSLDTSKPFRFPRAHVFVKALP